MNEDNDFSQAEQDSVWDLLDHASETKVSPNFAQNAMREARLSSGQTSSFIDFLRKPLILTPALAALTLGLFLWLQNVSTSTGEAQQPSMASAEEAQLPGEEPKEALALEQTTESTETWLEEALLESALEDPALFSDEELVAMIF